jgi:precorrin-6B methylase 2
MYYTINLKNDPETQLGYIFFEDNEFKIDMLESEIHRVFDIMDDREPVIVQDIFSKVGEMSLEDPNEEFINGIKNIRDLIDNIIKLPKGQMIVLDDLKLQEFSDMIKKELKNPEIK